MYLFLQTITIWFYDFFLKIHIIKLFILTSAAYHTGTDLQIFLVTSEELLNLCSYLCTFLEIFLKYISFKNKLWIFFCYIIVAYGVSFPPPPTSLHCFLLGGIGTKGSIWLFFFKLKTFLYLNWNLSYWNKINYWIHHIKGHIFSMLTFVFPSACQKSIWRWWEICHIQDQVEFNNLYNLYLWC